MNNFTTHYLWIIILVTSLIFILYLLFRVYQIWHLDFSWEKKRHFPQWSNNGIITRDDYLLNIEHKFVENSKYIVIGVHSMGTSKEDFKSCSNFFVNNGISFLSFDQRGWGENNKWKYHTLGTSINDIKDIILVIKEKHPQQKVILLGESLGSALAALASRKLKNLISGIIITNFVTKNVIFRPNLKLIWKAFIGFFFHKHVSLPVKFDMNMVSSNEDYIELSRDRLLHNIPFTFLFAAQAKKISDQVLRNVNKANCPTLVIQSGKDCFADFDKIKANSKKWRSGVTYHFYEEGQHALLNEPNIDMILTDTLKWLNKNF